MDKKKECSFHEGCVRNYEEDEAVRVIKKHFGDMIDSIKCEPLGQSTAPDYALILDGKKIALEVTTSSDGFMINKEGKSDYFAKVSHSFFGEFQKNLKLHMKKWIKPGDSFFLFCKIFEQLDKKLFKKLPEYLNKTLKHIYENGNSDCNKEVYKKDQVIHIDAKLIKCEKGEPFHLALMPGGSNMVPLDNQASFCLEIAVDDKAEKVKNVPYVEKWLAIVNRHPILNLGLYERGAQQIDKKCFSKIFIIHQPDSQVLLLE